MSNISTTFLLNEIQQGMLFEIERYKDRVYYINQEVVRFGVGLDVSVLNQAFSLLISKYEILRSAIVYNSDFPCFGVFSNVVLPFKFYDYADLADNEKNRLYTFFLDEDFASPMNLAIAPLMRVTIFKFSDNDFRMVWDIHHIIVDGFSVSILVQDLLSIYSSLLKQKPYQVHTISAVGDKHKQDLTWDGVENQDYWQKLLSSYELSSFLPTKSRGTEITVRKKKNLGRSFQQADLKQVVDFAARHNLTLNTMLQGAWAITLAHYSNNEHVVFGSVRSYPKQVRKDSIGLFINTLPMLFHIDPNMPLIDFLQQVRGQGKKLRDYVQLSLKQIRNWCGLPVDSQLYQAIINYEPFSLNKTLQSSFPDISCNFSSRLDVPYPLILEVIDNGDSLFFDLNYEEGLFNDKHMESFLSHYRDILLELITDTNKKLIDLHLLSENDFHKVVYEWNSTRVDYPIEKTVHQVFEEQAIKNPDALALVFKEEKLSYRILNERANQLAHYLLQQGVVVEDRIAIWLDTKTEFVVSILAILKAGCAYVPFDVNSPAERIKYILQDSRPKIILTDGVYVTKLSDLVESLQVKSSVVNLDQQRCDNCSTSNPIVAVQSSNLVYIIYTSGSTGVPKGSLIEHFSVVNLALSFGYRLKISEQSRVLQISSFSFDASAAEWSMTLLNGATLYLIDKHVFSPQNIFDALKKHKITEITLPYSILTVLPEMDLPYLNVIAPGGESVGRVALSYWGKNHIFLNVYGITEVSACSIVGDCTPEKEIITIGKPLANVQAYILNKYKQVVPPWVVGEIYIGGCGVGRGYLNNGVLTQEKFIDDPFGRDILQLPGKKCRLYKTGDLGRWTDDGEIDCIGRLDDQVKIRGLRIELSEVERVLEKYPGIEKAIVMIKELSRDTKQLVAYVLCDRRISVKMLGLQKYLSDYLPGYMVPVQIIQIDKLPITIHGKIDKKKLLQIENHSDDNFEEERNDGYKVTEKKISASVRDILKIQNVPIGKNFLDIGFDSFTIIKLSIKLSEVFNKEVSVTTLFTYTTIAKLAAFIDSNS